MCFNSSSNQDSLFSFSFVSYLSGSFVISQGSPRMIVRTEPPVADWPGSSASSDTEKGNETDRSQTEPSSPPAPKTIEIEFDNPRGWIPVAAAACSLFVYLGVIYSWGIMQVRLVETTSSSLTTLTFVGSLGTSFMISLSVLSGIAVRKLGYQKTALSGAVLMGLGEFLASWTTKHVGALFVFHGVIFGIGGGLCIFVSLPDTCLIHT